MFTSNELLLLCAVFCLAIFLFLFALKELRQIRHWRNNCERHLIRRLAAAAEYAWALENRNLLRNWQNLSTQTMAEGVEIAEALHSGISSIPFSILESIPATRAGVRSIRDIHDSALEDIYGGLGTVNRQLGNKLGRVLRGKKKD